MGYDDKATSLNMKVTPLHSDASHTMQIPTCALALHCSTFFRSAAYTQWHLGYLTLDKTHFSSHLKMSLVWPSVVISWRNSEFVSFRMWPFLHCLAAGHSSMCVCAFVCVCEHARTHVCIQWIQWCSISVEEPCLPSGLSLSFVGIRMECGTQCSASQLEN